MTDIAALYQSLSDDRRRLLAARMAGVSAQGPVRDRLVAFVAGKTGESAADPQALRDWLGACVPAHMVPDIIELLPEMPRLPNGKIDRRDLATRPLQGRSDSKTPPATLVPDNATEVKLAEIWSELLGVHPIMRDDNFFELGGDSIVAIQFLSRARQAGIALEPSDIAEHQTIAALALANRQKDVVTSGDISETAPLLPAQHGYLDEMSEDIGACAVARLFDLDATLTPEHLRKALDALSDIHPALRTRFEATESGWQQVCDLAAPELVMARLTHDNMAGLQGIEAAARSRLSLEGPLAQVAHIEKDTGGNQLLLVLHPLIADETSWRVLLGDFEAVARTVIAGRAPDPAHATSPLRLADAMARYADTTRLGSDIACWTDVPEAGAFRMPLEATAALHHDGPVKTLRRLDPALSQQLLSDANQAYNTSPLELLLAGLTMTMTQATGRTDTVIALEADGRDLPLQAEGANRTMAPLTTSFPVHFDNVTRDDPAAVLKNTKETHRRYCKNAASFAIARHFAPSGAGVTDWPGAALFFAFQGGAAEPKAPSLLSPVENRSPAVGHHPPFDLTLNATVEGDALHLSLLHDPARYSAEAASAFLTSLQRALEEVATHCAAQTGGSFTPSDFPEADLNQSELDDFLNALDADDG